MNMATSFYHQILTLAASAILFPTAAVAQVAPDSIPSTTLDEIVVEAPEVIRKADMDVYYPPQSAITNSGNGMQLLTNLMIPSLTVTEALGTVKAGGQDVQLRINGREASAEQVKALLPSTIKRVEWIDNPGLRYQGASYVLNFIVINPAVGGSLQTEARQALNAAWGDYFADAKFNNGPSQFEIGSMFKLTNKVKFHRDYKETFTYPDGTSLTRTETPVGGHVDNSFGLLWGAYSYIKPDTTTIYVMASVDPTLTDRWTTQGLLKLNNGSSDIRLTDSNGNKGMKPRISAYFEHHFSNRQTIAVDFSTSLYFGKSYSDYIEQPAEHTGLLTDIHTMIKDRNRAYAIEADYIRQWRNSRLTAGASYTANRNRSVYENLSGRIFHQRQDKVYFFAEYFQRIGKVNLTAGLGAQYTDYFFRETGQGSHSWNLRPQATISYRPAQNHRLRLSFQSWQSAPSLTESNVTPQQIDGFQWRVGNSRLKTSSSYRLTFRYDFSLPRVEGSFGIRAFSSPDAIAPYLYWEADRLITTYENSHGLQSLTFFLSPQIEIIPDWLTASGHLQYRVERMKGTGYRLLNRNWSGNAAVMLTHWGFQLIGQYIRSQHDLWGEKISWKENLSLIQLTYNMKDWQFGAGLIMPFGKYDQGSKMMSRWNTNERHMRLDMRMPYLSISYNIRWGRQKSGARKLVNADADVSTSTAGAR